MKYPNWETYTDEQKQNAVKQELRLDTHNGTTKDDFVNIIYYLSQENNKLKEENARLRRICASYEVSEGVWE